MGASWSDDVHGKLKAGGIALAGYVPDAGFATLIDLIRADSEIADVALTSEEEGVGLVAGAWLGGTRSVLLMQSSGVGNCVNMLSLQRVAHFPMVILVTMRGEASELNPWQVPMGSSTEAVLELCGFRVERVESADMAAETIAAAIATAFGGDRGVAVLLSQTMIGQKKWVD